MKRTFKSQLLVLMSLLHCNEMFYVIIQDRFDDGKILEGRQPEFPVKTEEELIQHRTDETVVQICQLEDKATKQISETGYCEVIRGC